MASRPLAFGVRFKDKGRTVRVVTKERRRFVVEDARNGGGKRSREHGSLTSALRDFAGTWRGRLN